MSNQYNNYGSNGKKTDYPIGITVVIIIMAIGGFICMGRTIHDALHGPDVCREPGCYSKVSSGSAYCYAHRPKSSYSSGSSKSSYSSSSTKTKTSGSTSSSKSSSTSKSTKNTTTHYSTTSKTNSSKKTSKSSKKIDPDDLDIEGYYEDYKDDFEDIDDAWDDLLDNPDLWDDYD